MDQSIIKELENCAQVCMDCYNACQQEPERQMLERCMLLDQDCAAICSTTADVMKRSSENSDLFLELCGEICEKCASECHKHAHMDHCRKCAETCDHCADMCKSFRIS